MPAGPTQARQPAWAKVALLGVRTRFAALACMWLGWLPVATIAMVGAVFVPRLWLFFVVPYSLLIVPTMLWYWAAIREADRNDRWAATAKR